MKRYVFEQHSGNVTTMAVVENPFVKEVLRHIEVKTALGQELISRIEHLA
jgi:hypothetical protein